MYSKITVLKKSLNETTIRRDILILFPRFFPVFVSRVGLTLSFRMRAPQVASERRHTYDFIAQLVAKHTCSERLPTYRMNKPNPF